MAYMRKMRWEMVIELQRWIIENTLREVPSEEALWIWLWSGMSLWQDCMNCMFSSRCPWAGCWPFSRYVRCSKCECLLSPLQLLLLRLWSFPFSHSTYSVQFTMITLAYLPLDFLVAFLNNGSLISERFQKTSLSSWQLFNFAGSNEIWLADLIRSS